jgi:hypothetical protein
MTMTDASIAETYQRQFGGLSDAQLVAEVAAHLSIPRENPADSFVLHAPLELAARAALLPHVAPEQRERARTRLVSLLVQFDHAGSPVATVAADAFADLDHAATTLKAAIDRGELDDVDVAARWLGRTASPAELRRLLAADVLPRLAAAAHAPIFLYHLPRVAPRGEITGELVRGLARELGRYPDWRLHWIEERTGGPASPADALFDAIAATPPSEVPGSTFIFPLMSSVDAQIAPRSLAAVTAGHDVADRGRALLRAAAWSMLLEPDDHAPYGWSHCLTMPQAVLGVSGALDDPSLALAVAATYVVGFRSPLAQRPLRPRAPEADGRLGVPDAIDAGRAAATAAVWHAPDEALGAIATELATRASTAHDAHLVKYTLACFDAAAADPSHRRLFLTAAASLAAWWVAHGDPTDPLAP